MSVLIPKEQDPKSLSKSIVLLNVEGKIYFSITAKRMTTYLTSNGYIDTTCHWVHRHHQEAGVPGFPGCVKYSSLIWDSEGKERKRRFVYRLPRPLQRLRVCSSPTYHVCPGLLLCPWCHQRPDNRILLGFPDMPPTPDCAMYMKTAQENRLSCGVGKNEDQALEVWKPFPPERGQEWLCHLQRKQRGDPLAVVPICL